MKLKSETKEINTSSGTMKLIILRPVEQKAPLPGILWIHGGGYTTGMAAMVHYSCGMYLAQKYGAVVISPEYRLATEAPYPAALDDCYAALCWLNSHTEELNIRQDKIIVGGESAGGGLAAAVCLYARDQGEVKIAMQIPLYPMLDCEDTPSSADNHGRVWDTKRNHKGWAAYLGELYGTDRVPKYASPSRETNYAGLPPCYTYVLDGEPFYSETLTYVENLKKAGIDAHADVFHGNIHAFDALFWTENSKEAREKLCRAYEKTILNKDASFKVYIAGPLFSDGEKAFNLKVEQIISQCGHETYLPQRDGGIIAELPDRIDGISKQDWVFRKDCQNLESADIFLLLMDGRVPDEGACFALGYCYAHGIRCVGYKTDVRSGYDGEDNVMLSASLERILRNETELREFFNHLNEAS